VPQFFIDIADGELNVLDESGMPLPDAEAARIEAIGVLALLAKDKLPDSNQHDFKASVRDEGGKEVFRALLSLRAEWVE